MSITPQDVYSFWFGDSEDDHEVAQSQATLWWGKSTEVDAQIKFRFGAAITAATSGELDSWLDSPIGRLALIILIDQFCRNVYRNTPAAFARDHLARQWTLDGIAAGIDKQLRPIERVFFYLPLEHSEKLSDQVHSVKLFRELADAAPLDAQDALEGFANYADQHAVIIQRFGRYPHRNAILGRESTPQEIEFLKQPGSSF